MMNNSRKEVKQMKEWFIKPKHEVEEESKKPILLSPWDLVLLSVHYNQKGLLFTKPSPSSRTFSIENLLETLRESLSETLVQFYPLAGQLETEVDQDRNEMVVFINPIKGPGVRFIHASLDMSVADLLHPGQVPSVVHSLFDHSDWRVVNHDGHSRPLLSVQVMELEDGIFIGCSFNHAVADGSSLWHFWNVWSEIHRAMVVKEDQKTVLVSRLPNHTRWLPQGCGPMGLPLPFKHPDEFINRYKPNPELKDRVFHVTSSSMGMLKSKANEEANTTSSTKPISSLQALAALVWRAITRAKRLAPEELTECRLASNNRSRLEPPLAQEYFGNAVQPIISSMTVEQLMGHKLGWTAAVLNQSVASHTNKAIHGFINRWVSLPFVVNVGQVELSNTVKVGSSPRFDIYSVEYGELGKPIAIRSGFANRFDGKVNFHPGCEGGGSVDLEICLMPDFMEALQLDQEFMEVVSSSTFDDAFTKEIYASKL